MLIDMATSTQSCRVAPFLLGLVLALSDSTAVAHSTRRLPGPGASSGEHGRLFPTDSTSSDHSAGLKIRRLLFSTRHLVNHTDGHEAEAPHDHGGAIGTHSHPEEPADHTHEHTHNNTAPHAHGNDTDGHVHTEHAHGGLEPHAHANGESDHEHDCHIHDGLPPHRHGDDEDGHEHTDEDELEPCEIQSSCTASTLPEFDCMDSLLNGNVIFHYQTFQTGDTSARMAIESPHEGGWAALGFGTSMLGTTAVIATTKAANGGVGVFKLGGFDASAITEFAGAVDASSSGRRLSDASPAFTISDASVERTGGRLVARFSRAYDDSFQGGEDFAAIVAYHGSNAALSETHEMRTQVDLSLTGGSATVASDNTPKLRRWHAGLMLVSWGMLLPLGVILAATTRTFGPKSMWFHLHRAIQTLGLVLATVGFFIAIAKFDSLPSDDSHRRLGIVVMVLGWVQPLNAFFRPHAPEAGEKRSTLRLVWEVLHRAVGWCCISLSISTVIKGLHHAKTFEGLREHYEGMKNAYIVVGVGLIVLLVVMLPVHIMRVRKRCADGQRANGDYVKSTEPEAEGVGTVHSVQPPDSP